MADRKIPISEVAVGTLVVAADSGVAYPVEAVEDLGIAGVRIKPQGFPFSPLVKRDATVTVRDA